MALHVPAPQRLIRPQQQQIKRQEQTVAKKILNK